VQAVLIERYTTGKKKGQWHARAEAVLYITGLGADEITQEDLLANLVITLFRIHGVTSYTAETRRIALDLRRALRLLDLISLSPG
jgi:hypothetical protein